MCRFRFNAGFTLVELLIAITILAILAAVAIPSFAETIIRNQTASQNNELIALIHLARNEAIRRNPQGGSIDERTVRVQLVPNGNSWAGFVRPPSVDEAVVGCPEGTIRCSENQSVAMTLVENAAPIRFDNRGYSVNDEGSPTVARVELVHARATLTNDRHQRCLTIFPGGQVRSLEGAC